MPSYIRPEASVFHVHEVLIVADVVIERIFPNSSFFRPVEYSFIAVFVIHQINQIIIPELLLTGLHQLLLGERTIVLSNLAFVHLLHLLFAVLLYFLELSLT